ncbi:copper resistance protein CopD [Sphingobium sp. TKS]|nr:copper resistance protein CopD [Sphingobium sp. TKS]
MGLEAIHLVSGALYADLGLLFGAPLFAMVLAKPHAEPLQRGTLAVLAVTGLCLSLAGFALTAAAMGGTSVIEMDPDLFTFVVTGTAVGWAFLVRLAALVLILVSTAISTSSTTTRPILVVTLAAVSVASQAWSGHAAASDGAAGLVRLAGDIAHLLTASVWLGALVILLRRLLAKLPQDEEHRIRTWQMLASFGSVGTIVVATLILTGLLNAAFLLRPVDLRLLPSTQYGQLLLLKLTLFGVMLGLAALNRFRLSPALARADKASNGSAAVLALRVSVGLEFTLAGAILLLVGWLGTLEPTFGG